MSNFQHPSEKSGVVSIATIGEGPHHEISAQYNPSAVQVDMTIPWNANPQSNKSPEKGIQLEFTGAQGRTMSLELTFDGYEKNESIAGKVATLNKMASVIDPGSSDENLRRPYHCVVTWGSTIANFRCVIESLSTKYTMFSDTGVPLRATCTVKLKEADVVKMKKDDGK
jgi:hypothetical protein